MSNFIHYNSCPVCGSSDVQFQFDIKDYTVSGETFPIVQCNSCTVRFTQDIPDEKFIAPYYNSEEYISHSNTSTGIINRLYQYVRKNTIKRKRRLVSKFTRTKKGSILDLGSGTGTFVKAMVSAGWNAKGIEPDTTARDLAKRIYQVELSDTNEFYKLPKESFDAITLWHVLEHVHNLAAYLNQLKLLLKKDGKLFIAVPNYRSKDATIYREYWAAYDVPRHLYHFSPESMEFLLNKGGFGIVQYRPMWYDSFYISLLSSKYKNGRTHFIAALWNGLRSNLSAMANVKKCSSVIYIIEKI